MLSADAALTIGCSSSGGDSLNSETVHKHDQVTLETWLTIQRLGVLLMLTAVLHYGGSSTASLQIDSLAGPLLVAKGLGRTFLQPTSCRTCNQCAGMETGNMAARFPEALDTHSSNQVFWFKGEGLLMRHD